MRGPAIFVLCVGALSSTSAFTFGRGARPQFQLNGQSQEPVSPRDDQVKQAAKAVKMTGAAILSLGVQQAEMQAAKAAEEGVEKTTESGLKYVDIKVGDGSSPVPGDTVRVHYTGWLEGFESEKKFDSSYDRRSPLVFRVGTKQVIAGWDEILLTDMKVGTVRNVIIPASLGYGSRGAGGVIPPGATLYFKMELVGIGAR